MSKHTPGPWEIAKHKVDGIQIIVKSEDQFICNTLHGNDEANARRIVQCVNAHDDLLEALKELVEDVTDEDHEPHDWSEHVCIRNARAAIAKATK